MELTIIDPETWKDESGKGFKFIRNPLSPLTRFVYAGVIRSSEWLCFEMKNWDKGPVVLEVGGIESEGSLAFSSSIQTVISHGNVVAQGVSVPGTMRVEGDLIVKGVVDSQGDRLVVDGDLRAGGSILSRGDLFVHKSLISGGMLAVDEGNLVVSRKIDAVNVRLPKGSVFCLNGDVRFRRSAECRGLVAKNATISGYVFAERIVVENSLEVKRSGKKDVDDGNVTISYRGSFFAGEAKIEGGANLGGDAFVKGSLILGKNLSVGGVLDVGKHLTVGNLTAEGPVHVGGNIESDILIVPHGVIAGDAFPEGLCSIWCNEIRNNGSDVKGFLMERPKLRLEDEEFARAYRSREFSDGVSEEDDVDDAPSGPGA